MRKEENTEKDELYGKLQVHFIENVEAEESSEDSYRGRNCLPSRTYHSHYRSGRLAHHHQW